MTDVRDHDDDLRDELQAMVATWEVPAPPSPAPHEVDTRARDAIRRRWWLAPAVAVGAVAAAVVAVAVLPSPPPSPSPADVAEASGLGTGDDYSVAGALAEVPVTAVVGPSTVVMTGDLAAATARNDATAPADPSDGDAVAAWTASVGGSFHVASDRRAGDSPGVPIPLPASFGLARPDELADVRAELGWTVFDLSAYVAVAGRVDDDGRWTGSGPTTVGLGADGLALADAVGQDEVATIGAGDGGATSGPWIDDATVARPNAAALHQRTTDREVAAAGSTEVLRARDDVEVETLADDPGLSAVASALDDQDVVGAALSLGARQVPVVDAEADRPVAAEAISAMAVDAVGFGWTVDDGRPSVAVALHPQSVEVSDTDLDGIAGGFELRTSDVGDDVPGLLPWGDAVEVRSRDLTDDGVVVLVLSIDPSPPEQGRLLPTVDGTDGLLVDALHTGALPFAVGDLASALAEPAFLEDPDIRTVVGMADVASDDVEIEASGGASGTWGWTGGFSGPSPAINRLDLLGWCDGGGLLHLTLDGVADLPPLVCNGEIGRRALDTSDHDGDGDLTVLVPGGAASPRWSVGLVDGADG